jgi:hypothetical protein
MNTKLSLVVAAIALFGVGIANACPPPPPGPPPEVGESAESHAARVAAYQAGLEADHQAWLHARQVSLWDEADAVFIARITRVEPHHLTYIGDTQRVSLRAEQSLKGRRYNSSFSLRYTDATSCGPMPSFAAINGAVGDRFVVFVRGGRPGQSTVQQTIAPSDITDERIRAALDAALNH